MMYGGIIMNLVDELQTVDDDLLFKNCPETDWVSRGISKEEQTKIKQDALKQFDKVRKSDE